MKKNEYERRLIDIRAVDDSEKMIVEGYAIVFDQPATHGKFTETIKRGALAKADMKDVPLRYNHNDSWMVIARTRNNSLQLIVDEKGLLIKAELLDTQGNRDIYKGIQAGLIDKMSFAFTVPKGGDTWTFGESETTRAVNEIDKLWDVSVVDTPFYDTTSVYARSLDLLESEKRRLDSSEIELLKQKIILKGKV